MNWFESTKTMGLKHRYLMSRLSLQVCYLWRHVLSTAPPFILWWSNLELLFAPLHRSSPFIGELRYQATKTEHIYSRENPKQAILWDVYCLKSENFKVPVSRDVHIASFIFRLKFKLKEKSKRRKKMELVLLYDMKETFVNISPLQNELFLF
jgi:hypothetical protein